MLLPGPTCAARNPTSSSLGKGRGKSCRDVCVCLSARVYPDEGIAKLKIMSHDGGRNPALLNSRKAQDDWQLPWKQHPLALPAVFLAQLYLCDPVTTPCLAAPLHDRVCMPQGQSTSAVFHLSQLAAWIPEARKLACELR